MIMREMDAKNKNWTLISTDRLSVDWDMDLLPDT